MEANYDAGPWTGPATDVSAFKASVLAQLRRSGVVNSIKVTPGAPSTA